METNSEINLNSAGVKLGDVLAEHSRLRLSYIALASSFDFILVHYIHYSRLVV